MSNLKNVILEEAKDLDGGDSLFLMKSKGKKVEIALIGTPKNIVTDMLSALSKNEQGIIIIRLLVQIIDGNGEEMLNVIRLSNMLDELNIKTDDTD